MFVMPSSFSFNSFSSFFCCIKSSNNFSTPTEYQYVRCPSCFSAYLGIFILSCITLPSEIHRLSIEGSVFYRIWTVRTIYPLEIESRTFCFRTKSLQSFIFYKVNSHSDSYLCYPSSFFLLFIQFWNPSHESSFSLTISYSV